MDEIKMEPGSDPMGIQTSCIADVEEKTPLSQEGNLLDLDVTKIKTECIDHRYDVKSEMTYEEAAVPIDFPIVKNEAEEEFCELDQVKEEINLEVTAEENEVLTESVAVSHNSGVATWYENIPKEEDMGTDEKKYDCDSATLRSHGVVHSRDKRITCDVCGRNFSNLGHLKMHARVHAGENVCGKLFTKSKYLKIHSQVHTGEKPLSCKVCGKKFSFLGNLKKHSLVHAGEKPFSCDLCGKGFSLSGNLKRHSRVHRDKPFSCDVCGTSVSKYVSLKRHSRAHVGEKPFTCDLCGRAFSLWGNLNSHSCVERFGKSLSCDVSERSCKEDTRVKRHSCVSMEEKPCSCDVCGRRFSSMDSLKSHSHVHTGEKQLNCHVCHRRFSYEGSLKTHLRDVCEKRCAESSIVKDIESSTEGKSHTSTVAV
ncbi:zinc finger protein 227-like isoform X3 [Periplaneta americana]|uniref:zinc finger protein 227-like isoform X3 n=1 Tax=Periplaneta americana TaxID=6978 RepID=UPI0037E86927